MPISSSINFLEYTGASGGVDAKGWTYSYVYYFREIRDIYLTTKDIGTKNKRHLYDTIKSTIDTQGQPWNDRRILEHLNALINFKLLKKDLTITEIYFNNSSVNSPISDGDIKVFEEIFFNYPRFRDFEFLFLHKRHIDFLLLENNSNELKRLCVEESELVYAFFYGQRYFNAFVSNFKLVVIPDDHKHVMRFWDVFIKWGRSLGLIEKFVIPLDLLPQHERNLLQPFNQAMTVVYFKSQQECSDVQVELCIKKNLLGKYIYIPKLVVLLAIETRCSLEVAKKSVVDFYLDKRETISIERTSEVFIDRTTLPFFPLFNGSFVSHLLLKK
ncbi:MAG: hypothetical protein ACRYG7_03595 [Janthinobacterium lividum]